MIRENMVFVNESFNSREEVIDCIGTAAKKNGLVRDKAAFIQAVMAREVQVSTFVGHQIAIPHGKAQTVVEAFVSYVNVKKPILWDKESKDVVRAIFLIGVPEADAEMTHLKYISEVSKNLIHEAFREKLFGCTEREQVFALLSSIR